jgi:hypothetical protein
VAGTKPGIEVEGGPQLRKAFRRLGERAGDLKALHGSIGQMVADTARTIVPIGDDEGGHLQDTIKASRRQTGASVSAGSRVMPYAGPIHFGWRSRNIEPQPFLYDALDDRRDDIVSKYRGGVDAMVRRFDNEAPR